MQVFKMYEKVNKKKQKIDLKSNFDIPKTQRAVVKKSEAVDFFEKLSSPLQFAVQTSKYENSTFSKLKGSLKYHHPGPKQFFTSRNSI